MIDTVNSIKNTPDVEIVDVIWIQNFNVLFKKDNIYNFFPTKTQTNEERINSIVRLSFYVSLILVIYHSNFKYSSIFVFILFFTFIVYKHHPDINSKTVEINKIDLSNRQQVELEAKISMNLPENNQSLNNFTPSLGVSDDDRKKKGSLVSMDGNTTQGVELIEHFNGEDGKKCTEPTLDNPFMNVTMKDYMNFDKDGSIVDRPAACEQTDPEVKLQVDNNFNNNLFRDVNDVFGKTNSQRQFFTMPYTTLPNDRESFQNWLYLNPATCKENQDNCVLYEDLRSNRPVYVNEFRNPNNSGARENTK